MPRASGPGQGGAMHVVRRLLLALLVFGMLATVLDLVLLRHFEDSRQFIPFGVIGLGLGVIGWHLVARNAPSVRALQAVMVLFIITGAVGVVLHYRGNMEFQLDTYPDLGGWELFSKVIHAKAPPAMAPGAMVQLGLLGLVYSYRHPALGQQSDSASSSSSPGV